MDIKSLILAKLVEKNQIKTADIVKATGFSRAYVSRFFHELCDSGEIIMLGKANQAVYVLADKKSLEQGKKLILKFSEEFDNKDLSEEIVLKRIKDMTGIFSDLPPNVVNLVEYSFLEMVNNAIEHSRSKKFLTVVKRNTNFISFIIDDEGVGIFNNIREKFKLENNLQAIQQLLKGKQTTDPKRHTGQGIFFTSKMADSFLIESSGKEIQFINSGGIDDVFIANSKKDIGTSVFFVLSLKSKRTIQEVFGKYTDKDTFEFSKTKILVRLSEVNKNLLSRSEARRIMMGLEDFKEIVLDFKGVEAVGQSFGDEIFRVWQNSHREQNITWQNANENVSMMIRLAL